MINTIDELIENFKSRLNTIGDYTTVSSEFGIELTDFQAGQIEGLRTCIKISIQQVEELKETIEINKQKVMNNVKT